MRYIILSTHQSPFYTDWFDYENHYSDDINMIFDIVNKTYSIDGKVWIELEEDSL